MVFNSVVFAFFFAIVFASYWLVGDRSDKLQNTVLLLSSLYFYFHGAPSFLGLMVLLVLVNFLIGNLIGRASSDGIRNMWLYVGIMADLLILIYFKYFDFFYRSLVSVANLFDGGYEHDAIQLILPLGISFITFQVVGYLIDVRNGTMDATKDLLAFSTYVLYFPKLLAGPIERARDLIPTLQTPRKFDRNMAVDGCRQFLWGLFSKVVIADNCAKVVDPIFDSYATQNTTTLALGGFLYAFQVYCDFSGYSNMAIGCSKLLGLPLMRNFAYPYFSTNIADYWRRWHISLSSWVMEYVFVPMSFWLRHWGKWGTLSAVLTTFIVVGLWHGANWTFVMFGVLHGICFIPLILRGKRVVPTHSVESATLIPTFTDGLRMAGMFLLAAVLAIFFRAEDLGHAIGYLQQTLVGGLGPARFFPKLLLGGILLFVLAEWSQRDREHPLMFAGRRVHRSLRRSIYYALVGTVLLFSGEENEFIYLQF